jgi:hypothetical protein
LRQHLYAIGAGELIMPDSCATCFFYGPNTSATYPSDCRFTKPDVNPSGINPQWPPVASTDWCAEFSLVAKAQNPWTSYTPQIASSVGAITTLGAVSCFYLIFQRICLVEFKFTITTNGTGAGLITLTMPIVAPATPTSAAGSAVRVADHHALAVLYDQTSNAVQLTLYDGTYPGVDGAVISGSMEYRLS